MSVIATWNGLGIDPVLLLNRGYADSITNDGVVYPRLLAYVAAGLSQQVLNASTSLTAVTNVITAAATAYTGTSSNSLTIATGAQTFTIATGKGFAAGQIVTFYNTGAPSNFMSGTVTSYNTGTGVLVVSVTDIGGTGTFAAWTVAVSGQRGQQGIQGIQGNQGIQGQTGAGSTINAAQDGIAVTAAARSVINSTQSIVAVDDSANGRIGLSLKNDVAAPGNLQLYGTGPTGVKGWFVQPTSPGSQYAAAALFGTGADGSVSMSSGATTLTRDMHYSSLTLSGTAQIKANGFRILVTGTLDISAAGAGAISANGADFIAGQGALGTPVISSYGQTGATGTINVDASNNGTPYPGSAASPASGTRILNVGGGSGPSGQGGAYNMYSGGRYAAPTASYTAGVQFPTPTHVFIGSTTGPEAAGLGNGTLYTSQGGSSGGSGGSDGNNSAGNGGNGGSPARCVLIYARFIARGTNVTPSVIQAIGGAATAGLTPANNSNNGGGGGGGGAGAGGGFIYIVTEAMTGSAITNALDVSGGNGGDGGLYKPQTGTGKSGSGGSGGNGGNCQIIVLATPSYFCGSFNTSGALGVAAVSMTYSPIGTGGAGAVVKVNL